eukprot:CAMPEP_0184501704 /NCGR_PEP_ID=MMETSP0113_2-20130426/48372_1 /TAXON_ID=91329 /ORGANISM="Norrisiella sphaerica, Strain BC52" /LENGTH=633 /DNA_ID=CAMNT_0026890559 /DNA_START=119 /DNA_END=2021 /DNA_ORIENTATION=-
MSISRALRRILMKSALTSAAVSATSATALYVYDDEVFGAAVRLTRCGVTAVQMSLSYSWHRWKKEGDEKIKATQLAHEINAKRLRDMLFQNKGIYIKVGQYLGTLDYLIPKIYVDTMSGCFDHAPESTWEEVLETIQQQLHADPYSLFASITKTPVASASLAQVHRGVTIDGEEVAIKVQHPHLRRMANTEVVIIESLLRGVRHFHPEFGFQWLVEEMKINIPKELDFIAEADNADRCRELLSSFGDTVVIPKIRRDLSTERLLTMSFEEGPNISDIKGIRSLGIESREVARTLSHVFAQLIFKHGFVHCDPHPGNVLVRVKRAGSAKETGQQRHRLQQQPLQLVLLDHGLYRELPTRLRLEFCELWRGIVLADGAAIKNSSKRLGIRSKWMDQKFPGMDLSHTLIAAMLSAREWDTIVLKGNALDRFDPKGTDQERREALSANVSEYMLGIVDVLNSCPRDLLLILKANDALRSVTAKLGGVSSDTFLITALACCRALLEEHGLDFAEPSTSRLSSHYTTCATCEAEDAESAECRGDCTKKRTYYGSWLRQLEQSRASLESECSSSCMTSAPLVSGGQCRTFCPSLGFLRSFDATGRALSLSLDERNPVDMTHDALKPLAHRKFTSERGFVL